MASYVILNKKYYYIKYRENNQRKQISAGKVYDKKTKKGVKLNIILDLVKHYSQIELNDKMGINVEKIKISISQALKEYLQHILLGRSKALLATGTKISYGYMTGYIQTWFDKISIDNFKYLTIDIIKKYVIDNSNLSQGTLYQRQKFLLEFLLWCSERGYYTYGNQLKTVPRLSKPKVQAEKRLEPDELKMLFTNAPEYIKDAIMFMYYTGSRVSDVGFLKWEDYNSNKKTLTFKINDGAKTKRTETVSILPIVCNLIEKQREKNIQSPYIFANFFGNRLTGKTLAAAIKKVLDKLKINESSHALRHTFATELLDNGAPIDGIKELLRHSDIKTTMIYAHIKKEKQKQALDCLPVINI